MLYALPDHQAMESLLPDIGRQRLPVDAAVEQLTRHPGLVPIAIDPEGQGTVYFADIGDTPLLEWKYIYTIERLAREGGITRFFVTDLAILDSELPAVDGLDPDGLIFHVSRCGSTLFCKALARLPANLVINQGGPLQAGFWAAVTGHWHHDPEPTRKNLRMLRNVVRLMARRRRPDYQRCYIKFISWNVVYLDFIRAAFPDACALYLYRDPAEVIAIVLQETTAALRARGTPMSGTLTGLPENETRDMGDIEFLAHCYAHYFRLVADKAERLRLGLVNYRNLKQPELFAGIVARGLGWRPGDEELEQMQAQYRYYSKDDSNRTDYRGEPKHLDQVLKPGDRDIVEAVVRDRTAALDRSPRNLFCNNSV